MKSRILRVGYLADGTMKASVGIALPTLFPLIVGRWGAPALLLFLTAVAVLASAAAEMAFAIRRGEASHTKYLFAYDAGWILATVAALLLHGAGLDGAWEVWLGYQLVMSPVIAGAFGWSARLRR